MQNKHDKDKFKIPNDSLGYTKDAYNKRDAITISWIKIFYFGFSLFGGAIGMLICIFHDFWIKEFGNNVLTDGLRDWYIYDSPIFYAIGGLAARIIILFLCALIDPNFFNSNAIKISDAFG